MKKIYSIFLSFVLIIASFFIWFFLQSTFKETSRTFIYYRLSPSIHAKFLWWVEPHIWEKWIIYVFDYQKKTVSLVDLYLNKKLPFTPFFWKENFNEIFDQIKLSTDEQKKYPNIPSVLYAQKIKEADFDSFLIMPGGFFSKDKKNIYSIYWKQLKWIRQRDKNKISTITGFIEPSPISDRWEYFPYYKQIEWIEHGGFWLFNFIYLVQKDIHLKQDLVYNLWERDEEIIDIENFMKNNIP